MDGHKGLAKLCTEKIINTKDNKKNYSYWKFILQFQIFFRKIMKIYMM